MTTTELPKITSERLHSLLFYFSEIDFSIDLSWMGLSIDTVHRLTPQFENAFKEMVDLERGAISNLDEKRMVGHYWLRAPHLAPKPEITTVINATNKKISEFAKRVLDGELLSSNGKRFRKVLVIGIGGSALGPQFVYESLKPSTKKKKKNGLESFFFDNTDPDGIERVLNEMEPLDDLLAVVVSKSGGTKETRNGQLLVKAALTAAGLDAAKHLVAVTGEGSELDATAKSEAWLERFPMWDWVGGRTSEMSAVGLLPAALQGIEFEKMLQGACAMDELTRKAVLLKNPAALLGLSWYHAGEGKGRKDMVVLPYFDRILLFSRYLQQLVMESLGKTLDRKGAEVFQGIAVYGNKGSTDQHAYVQQLRDGIHNFFATFIEVLEDKSPLTQPRKSSSAYTFEVEEGVRSGDYLSGFLQGTRQALHQKGRESITITIPRVDEFYVGALIALFERAVGLYASLVDINAYHQPGVEAGKKAATRVLELQHLVLNHLKEKGARTSPLEVVKNLQISEEIATVTTILRKLGANKRIKMQKKGSPIEWRYWV